MPGPSVGIVGTRGYPSYYGGFETAVRQLAPYLADRGWDVTVYGRPANVNLEDPERDHRVRSVFTQGVPSESLSTLSYGFTSMLQARRSRPDVLLVMNIANGFWLPMAKSRGIPTLVNVDGIEWEREKWGRAARLAFRAGARLTARLADEIVVDSREIARRWREDLGREGIYIAYGGTTLDSLPAEPGLEPGSYALAVARLVPENSIAEFLRAAEIVAREHSVVLVGAGSPALEAYARDLDHRVPDFHWLGAISDDSRLHALWQHAGVYFHGHSVGGTNPALVQAMASGAAIVARDTPFNREVLGSDGLLVQPDPAEIAAALKRVLSDPTESHRLRDLGRSRASQHYTWDKVCAAYEAALRALIPGG